MSNKTLQLVGITKKYGERKVLDDISFSVPAGHLTGFVGANGAGKTTTMRIILGLLNSDGGSVTFGGTTIDANDRRGFGYMPEERGLYPKMKVLDQVSYFARLHGFSKADATQRATALLEELDLGERLHDTLDSLSLGNQQRAQIAASLVHDPTLLVLDEPFSGLDPLAVDTVASVLHRRAEQGVGVLFSSHQLDVVERLCDDLVILAGGTIRASGAREDLRAQHSRPRWEIETSTALDWLSTEPGVTLIESAPGSALFEVDKDETAQYVLRKALEGGNVTLFAAQHPSLAQIFKEVIQ